MNWIEALAYLHKKNRAHVLLTVLDTQGSSPRDFGSKMVVSNDEVIDTIGGGALEHEAIKLAHNFLQSKQNAQYTKRFNLGKDLQQCCGGVVTVFFEVFAAIDFNIVIFGAGHIGQAIIKILEDIDCHVKWIDSRAELFPENCVPHIQKITTDQPELVIETCQENSYYLVMTHDHALDQILCESILSRNNDRYCGLIGSKTKALKFRQRMQKKGYKQKELERLICPIGLSSIKTKKPTEIAVSVIAELLALRDAQEN